MCGFMFAEYDDLPDAVKREVQAFADVNTAWLTGVLGGTAEAGRQALAIFAALAGAQLIARAAAT